MKLVGDEIGGVEPFMKRFKVGLAFLHISPHMVDESLQMDHPAALHRLTVGVPATVEHSAEATDGGAETGKWVAETTQVGRRYKLRRRD